MGSDGLSMMGIWQGCNSKTGRRGATVCCAAMLLGAIVCAQQAEQPGTTSAPSQNSTEATPATQQPTPATPPANVAPAATPQLVAVPAATPPRATPEAVEPGAISEEELKHLLVGKPLYLRAGYLDNTLSFNEHGQLIGHSPQGSFTLNGLEIDRVRLTKHKVELEGARYGLHFLGALAYEDPTTAVDRVRITPKKKVVKITIDREMVVKAKKEKPEKTKGKHGPVPAVADKKTPADKQAAATNPTAEAKPTTDAKPADEAPELSEADQLKAAIAAAPAAERPADPKSVTTTTSPAHATKLLKDALDSIFAPGLDERMMASLPEFWKLYYQAAAAKTDYRPKDPSVLRQNAVDRKARLISTFEPASNEFAQANGVAGMALYHTVIGPDGKPGEIAVGRPIGFGLDESAVESIRKASFQAAVKDGKPVPVLLDLVVQFRIYSNRTAATEKPVPEAEKKPAEPQLPGPYSVQHQ